MNRLITGVLLLGLVGGGTDLSAAPSRVTLWFHGGTAEESQAEEAQIRRFNDSQDDYEVVITKIRDDYFSSGSSFSYSAAVYAAALAGELPDVLDLDGPNLANYAWRGFLTPLDGVIPPELKADLLPTLIQQGTYRGTLYAVGPYESGLALAGRRSLLLKAGIRIPRGAADPWTFEEFQSALAKLKALKATPYVLDLKMNYGANEWYSYAFAPLVQGFGGDLIDRPAYRKSAGTLDSPASAAALAFLRGLFEAGYARLDSTDEDFVNGTAALGFCGHWTALAYRRAFPQDFVLLPMPVWGKKAATGMGSWAWGISRQATNPQGAQAFLRFLLRPEEVQAVAQANGAIPGRKSVLARSPLYQPGGPLEVFAQQLRNGTAVIRPQTPVYPVMSIAFYTAVNAVLTKKTDISTALRDAAQRIDANLAANGYGDD